jgi:cell division protein FtsL
MAVPARKVRQLPAARPTLRPVPPRTREARAHPRPARRARRRTPFALFSLTVVTVLVMLLASAQAIVAQQAFRVADLTRSIERLEEGHGQLRLKLAEMTSPQRLVRAARRFGLVLPDRVELLEIDPARPGGGTGGTDEGTGGVPLPAEGAGPGLLAKAAEGEEG